MASNSPPTAKRDPANLVGKTVAERYRVTRCIGVGGMGIVYLAEQIPLERNVVLKVTKRAFSDEGDDDENQARFMREARAMSRLDHPNVVRVFDFGSDEALGVTYLAMEYVHGVTLRKYIKRVPVVPMDKFAGIAREILRGVGAAHALGLVHRDLKPSNIMVAQRAEGEAHRVKVLDFGLSKLASGGKNLTRPNQILGTALYMAPEAIRAKGVDQRADVYALGAIFYRMLTGTPHLDGEDSMALMYQQVHGEHRSMTDALPDGQDVPPALVALIEQCLQRDPDARPKDANAMLAALDAALAGVPVAAGPLHLGAAADVGRGDDTERSGSFSGGVPAPVSRPNRQATASAAAPVVSATSAPSMVRNTFSSPSMGADGPSAETHLSQPTANQQNAVVYLGFIGTLAVVLLLGALLVVILLIVFPPQQPATAPPTAAAIERPAPPSSGDTALLLQARIIAVNQAMNAGEFERALAIVDDGLRTAPADADTSRLRELRGVVQTLLAVGTKSASQGGAPGQQDAVADAAAVEPAPAPRAAPEPAPTSRATAPKPAPERVARAAAVAPRPSPKVVEPEPEPEPEPVQLTPMAVTSVPLGLRYRVADREGVTPAVEQLEPGSYLVQLFGEDGDELARQQLVVEPGRSVVFSRDVSELLAPEPEPEPEPAPPVPPAVVAAPAPEAAPADASVGPAVTGSLLVHSDNVFGEIWINGTSRGYPPISVDGIEVGPARVEVRVKGNVRRSSTVTVRANERVEVRL